MSQHRRYDRISRKRLGVTVLMPAGLVLLMALSPLIWGCGEEGRTEILEASEAPPSSVSGLSLDQSKVVEELGYPDQFFISIDPLSSDRVETWIYYSEGKSIDFDNGRRFGEESVEDESSEFPPTDLHPQDFDTLLTPGGAEQILGSPLYTQQVEDSLSTYSNTIVVFDKAILLFRGEQLIGVETNVSPPQIQLPQ